MATTVTGPKMQALLKSLAAMGFTYASAEPPQERRTRIKPIGAPSIAALMRTIAVCPNCGFRGRVAKSFGVRNMGNGTVRVQSWCRDCRKDSDNQRAKALRKAARHGR